MKIANFTDYELIETGNGNKLERWKDTYLLRPDPQAIWQIDLKKIPEYKKLNAIYERSSTGGGMWNTLKPFKGEWIVGDDSLNLKFIVKPMGFKHTGLFPEQAVNWQILSDVISSCIKEHDEIKVLNLFGYTGAATVACLKAGASVTHVDASKGMVDRCKQNVNLNNLGNKKVRYIVDDCDKFVEREIRRGNFYDIIIMDPPSFGRGPNGETWKLENNIFDFVKKCAKLLSNNPLAFLINSYTTGLQAVVMENILRLTLKNFKGTFTSYELGLKATNSDIVLPCGTSALYLGENIKVKGL